MSTSRYVVALLFGIFSILGLVVHSAMAFSGTIGQSDTMNAENLFITLPTFVVSVVAISTFLIFIARDRVNIEKRIDALEASAKILTQLMDRMEKHEEEYHSKP